jgi:hypothetical protein
MTNPEIKAISFGAVEQLNLDLLQCESNRTYTNYFNPLTNLFINVKFINIKCSQTL